MTKSEWKRLYGIFRRVIKLNSSYFKAERNHKTRPISHAELRKLQNEVHSGWRTFCGVFARKGDGGSQDGRTHYTWRTACYDDRLWAGDSMPWAQTYQLGSKESPYRSFIGTSGQKGGKGSIWLRWRDNYRKLTASGLAPVVVTGEESGLAPTLGRTM